MMWCGLNTRSRGAQTHARALTTIAFAVLLLLFCEAAHLAHAFAFVPVIQSFAVQETSANSVQSRLLCQQGGGYVAGEPTAALHESVVQTVRAAGAGAIWYAFLGADTEANAEVNCPIPSTEGGTGGATYGCYWRWNQGRWTEMQDNTSLPLYINGVGVTFYVGNTYRTPTAAVTTYGPTGGFPIFFNTAVAPDRTKRPGAYFGKQLVAVGTGDTATWSDNAVSGGYTYAGYVYSTIAGSSRWNATAQAASKPYFWAVCQAQAPSRTMYEMTNTTSGLQQNWWVIFLVILFVLTLIAFIVVAACQDDEDMDEPPEDAPEWAQAETQATQRPKSFVSTRSFHGNAYDDEDDYDNRRRNNNSGDEDDDDADDAGRNGKRGGARRGSTSSDVDSRHSSEDGGFRGRRRGSNDDGYPTPAEEQRQQQQQQPRAPSAAGSTRHLGRQNGSMYNTPPPQLQQY